MEIYTYSSNPFRMGGPQQDIIKTVVEEYERISIGKGYFAIVCKNTVKDLWHIALEQGGAIIMTDNDKAGGIRKVKHDVEIGDEKLMKQQVQRSLREVKTATLLESNEFFRRFK